MQGIDGSGVVVAIVDDGEYYIDVWCIYTFNSCVRMYVHRVLVTFGVE